MKAEEVPVPPMFTAVIISLRLVDSQRSLNDLDTPVVDQKVDFSTFSYKTRFSYRVAPRDILTIDTAFRIARFAVKNKLSDLNCEPSRPNSSYGAIRLPNLPGLGIRSVCFYSRTGLLKFYDICYFMGI